jgi:hypothetical protein
VNTSKLLIKMDNLVMNDTRKTMGKLKAVREE